MRLDYERYCVIVVNDGSTDRTSELAHEHSSRRAGCSSSTGRLEVAGRGKGAVLNEGYRILNELLEQRDPLVAGFDPDDAVVGRGRRRRRAGAEGAEGGGRALRRPPRRRRADGRRDRERRGRADRALPGSRSSPGSASSPRRPATGSARSGWAATGSSRASPPCARSGGLPGRTCLTEDLDLGLHLKRLGWHIRFCRTTAVTQQGVRTLRAWIRQRTRWAQGHYQCWDHVPGLVTARNMPADHAARPDALPPLRHLRDVRRREPRARDLRRARLGRRSRTTSSRSCPAGPPRNIAMEVIGLSPVVMVLTRYQQNSPHRCAGGSCRRTGRRSPSTSYIWAIASLIAWFRLMRGRGGWTKTRRVAREARAVRVVAVLGTRPEVIKLAPVVAELRRRPGRRVRRRRDRPAPGDARPDAAQSSSIEPDVDLDVMRPEQRLSDLTADLVRGLGEVLAELRPDWVVVQGDTSTTMCGALAAFYENVPVAHVEAGLRSGDRLAPFPEEVNRTRRRPARRRSLLPDPPERGEPAPRGGAGGPRARDRQHRDRLAALGGRARAG